MIAALNLIPLALLALAAWAVWREAGRALIRRRAAGRRLCGGAAVLPAQRDGGTQPRARLHPFGCPIQDRNRKPTPIEERDQRMQEAVRKGLDLSHPPKQFGQADAYFAFFTGDGRT